MRAVRVLVALLCCLAVSSWAAEVVVAKGTGPKPLPVNQFFSITCGQWGAQRVLIGTEVSLDLAQTNQFKTAVCAGVHGVIAEAASGLAGPAQLQSIRFVAQAEVEGSAKNALYDPDTHLLFVGVGLLDADAVLLPAAIFSVGHELGHWRLSTGLKKGGIEAAGAVSGVAGAVTWLVTKSPKARLVGTAIAVAGATLAVCPSIVYKGELKADEYGFLVLRTAYLKRGYDALEATSEALRFGVLVAEITPQDEDEKCLERPEDGHFLPVRNKNPHPSTKHRIENLQGYSAKF